VGTSRIECAAYVDFSTEELKQCKVRNIISRYMYIPFISNVLHYIPNIQEPSFTAVDKSDSVGWAIRVEVHSCDSVANGMVTWWWEPVHIMS